MADGRTIAALGWAILAAGAMSTFVSAVLAGWFAGDAAGGDAGSGYDAARAALLLVLVWVAGGLALWRAGRLKLFAAILAVAIVGFAMGRYMGDPEFETSADSRIDVGLVIGIGGSLIGLFLCWSGARLAWPSTSRHSPGQNSSPPTGR